MSTHHDLFHALLFNPPGAYALSSYGQTHAVILTGDAEFHTKGYNLMVSFGGEAPRPHEEETPLPPIHLTDDPRVVWFCLPELRVKLALSLYFNAQLVRANLRDVLDEEGDFVEVVCDREAELWVEAEQLACDFMVSHMRSDYRALPSYEEDGYAPTEHGMGHLGAAHESE